ncbi:1-deoxy-D-xylulose-5-phosphate synthase [Granulosicoccus sp.]|nr:1-deoxy-D-xylulose-5-phosphate synthase [Granulosicoccus sp.]MDB4222588.1 1-deoxy-D-xylulose-5-phosphate synthase [Granulosicoccus sp.]
MTIATNYPLLESVYDPSDLRKLEESQLPQLASELREYVIDSVSRTGGHLGASLGTIELTVALHYVFNTPIDKLVWDVGHQTYGHKILTQRREKMSSIRKQGGLAGFPNRAESEYDTFGVGHSSTSISAALGMALAAKHQAEIRKADLSIAEEDRRDAEKVVAVIGDGALTAGLAYEALNHAGGVKANMLVVLNDNDMSISPNVGAMNKYLARMLTGKLVSGAREGSKRVLAKVPTMHEIAKRTEEQVKGLVVPSSLFEELGFNYFGPVDGHDVDGLVAVLKNLRDQQGPFFLHVVTKKGHGYKFAEQDPLALHAVSPFNPATGKALKSSQSNRPTYTQVFGQWLCDMAEQDERLVGITPAMREGSGMVEFEKRFPDRYYDVGIAEQHSVTLAAGLACGGMKPVVAIYSTFFQRAYDQLIHDVVLQNLPVVFAIDRAGVVGPDGPTHAGSFDFSFMRCLPNIVVMAPADENECRQMLYTAMQIDGPSSVRYPRGTGPGVDVEDDMQELAIGKSDLRHKGHRVAILAFGTMVSPATQIGKEMDFTVVNMRFVKPQDTAMIEFLAKSHDMIITIEENAIAGGAGAGVLEHLASVGSQTPVKIIGLPDEFVEHGSREELLTYCQLDVPGLRSQIEKLVATDSNIEVAVV